MKLDFSHFLVQQRSNSDQKLTRRIIIWHYSKIFIKLISLCLFSSYPGDHGATGEKGLQGEYGDPGIPGKDGEPGTPGHPGMSEGSNRACSHAV